MVRKVKASSLVVVFLLQLITSNSCTQSPSQLLQNGHVTAWVAYQLPLIPIKFVWDSDGKFTIKAEASISTAFGTVSFGSGYTPNLVASRYWSEPSVPAPVGALDIVIRDVARNEGQIYSIPSIDKEIIAVIDGSATLRITNRQIVIEVSNGVATTNMAAGEFNSLGILPAPVLGEFIPDDSPVIQYPGSFPQKLSNCENNTSSSISFPSAVLEPFSITPKGDVEWEIEGTSTKGSGTHFNGGKLPIDTDFTEILSTYRPQESASLARSLRWQIPVSANSESDCVLKWWEIWRQGHINVSLLDRKIATIKIRYFWDVEYNYQIVATRGCGNTPIATPRGDVSSRTPAPPVTRPAASPLLVEGLRSAAQAGSKGDIELWLKRGVPVNARDSNGRTALMLAGENGHSDAARFLLERGGDVNAQDNNGRTALIIAVIGGHDDTVKVLLAWRADVNIVDAAGRTALAEARSRNNRQIVRLLESAGAWR